MASPIDMTYNTQNIMYLVQMSDARVIHLLHESTMHAITMIVAAWTAWMSKQYNPVTAIAVAIAQMAEYMVLRTFAFMIVTYHTV